ncbi:TBCC domain-containing protein 1 [Trichoplax sp. H2]|nr:TBCC domain-containing protein 1 [Trichoplax sp. H2]|eukprot:RDD42856.1 TBCC domain-containing protein 1 [Trichoplax sp. H2]
MSVILWVHPQPLDCGLLHLSFYPRFTYNNLLKLAVYAKAKEKAGYPRLSYTVWRHVACNKLQMSEEHAWLLFKTFYLLSDWSQRDRINWIQSLTNEDATVTEQAKTTLSVKTLDFLLYLRIQQFTKLSLKSSLASGDEWPNRSKSPDLDNRNYAGSKQFDEQKYLSYVSNNLTELLQLLVEPEAFSENEHLLTADAVDALGFLIGGQVDGNVMKVRQIASMSSQAGKSGFSKISSTYSLKRFQSWLRSNLSDNCFGTMACLINGERLPRLLGRTVSGNNDVLASGADFKTRDERQSSASPRTPDDSASNRSGKIISNRSIAPASDRLTILAQVCKQTIIKTSEMEHSGVKIYRCHFSYIYLLAPLKYVIIEKCRHTTVVLGAVETTVHCISGDDITVIATCHQFFSTSSNNCTYHLCTPSKPVMFIGNNNITIAPYHTFYPLLSKHMQEVGLLPTVNLWDQVISIGPRSDSTEPTSDYKFMKLSQFRQFIIPLTMEGDTTANPCAMPMDYRKALLEKEADIKKWHQYLDAQGLSDADKSKFKKLVQEKFEEWLIDTGHVRHLEGLILNSNSSST